MRKNRSPKVMGMVLAGGTVPGLEVLSKQRTKAAVPFGGAYRIIDFALTNLAYADVTEVGVLTQHRPESLMNHLGNGHPWGMIGLNRCLRRLPPFTGASDSRWYRGNADAVAQNLDFIASRDPEHVLVVSGDHVYRMDYTEVLERHVESGAAVTLAVLPVPKLTYPSRFGLATVEEGWVTSYREKPEAPCGGLVCLSVYLFRKDALFRVLQASNSRAVVDFGRDVLPDLVAQKRVAAYVFGGPWLYLGDLQSYWQAHMDLLGPATKLVLDRWNILTNLDDRSVSVSPPPFVGSEGQLDNSMIGPGCIVEGEVHDSVLFPGCRVHPGAIVRSSVLMHGTVVGPRSRLHTVITDKDVTIGEGVTAGVPAEPADWETASRLPTTMGKNCHIPSGIQIGAGAIFYPGVGERELTDLWIPPHTTLQPKVEDRWLQD